jgi:hypothetical protein
MNIKGLVATCGTIVALFCTQLAIALSYCPKPNGVAIREVAYDDLGPLFGLVEKRLGSNQTYLFIVLVPPELPKDQKCTTSENTKLRQQAPQNPEFVKLASGITKVMKTQGFKQDDSAIREMLLFKKMSKPQDSSSFQDDRIVYLYSNDRAILEKLSSAMADKKGLVIAGSNQEVQELLSPSNQSSRSLSWWKSILPNDLDALVTVGFDAPPVISNLVSKDTYLLKVADWNTATEKGLTKLRGLMDVPPERAIVLNLFPTSTQQVGPWQFPADKAALFVENGKWFQSEYERLGYSVTRVSESLSAQDVMAKISAGASAGKKVLLIAETAVMPDGTSFIRLPGREDGLVSNDFNSMDDMVLENLLVVSCNSQGVSSKLPLSIIGTIYTDKANGLIRATFAAEQADSMSDYLQIELDSKRIWTEATARVSSSKFAPNQSNRSTTTRSSIPKISSAK